MQQKEGRKEGAISFQEDFFSRSAVARTSVRVCPARMHANAELRMPCSERRSCARSLARSLTYHSDFREKGRRQPEDNEEEEEKQCICNKFGPRNVENAPRDS